MCQGKDSGNAIDIPVSYEVTEGCFQIKPASLKGVYLNTKNRNIEIKLFLVFTVAPLVLNGLQMKAWIKDCSLSK